MSAQELTGLLAQCQQIRGVEAVLALDTDGFLLAGAGQDRETAALETLAAQVATLVRQTDDSLRPLGSETWQSAQWETLRGYLFVERLAGGLLLAAQGNEPAYLPVLRLYLRQLAPVLTTHLGVTA